MITIIHPRVIFYISMHVKLMLICVKPLDMRGSSFRVNYKACVCIVNTYGINICSSMYIL